MQWAGKCNIIRILFAKAFFETKFVFWNLHLFENLKTPLFENLKIWRGARAGGISRAIIENKMSSMLVGTEQSTAIILDKWLLNTPGTAIRDLKQSIIPCTLTVVSIYINTVSVTKIVL